MIVFEQKFDWILLWISLSIIDGLTINIKDLKELEAEFAKIHLQW